MGAAPTWCFSGGLPGVRRRRRMNLGERNPGGWLFRALCLAVGRGPGNRGGRRRAGPDGDQVGPHLELGGLYPDGRGCGRGRSDPRSTQIMVYTPFVYSFPLSPCAVSPKIFAKLSASLIAGHGATCPGVGATQGRVLALEGRWWRAPWPGGALSRH